MKRCLALAIGVIAVGGLALLFYPRDLAPRTFETNVYRDSGGDRMVVASGGTLLAQSGSTFTADSGSTVSLDSDPSFGAFAQFDAQTTLTIGDDTEIVPTGTYQRLTSTKAVGTSAITTTGMTAGDLLVLINVGSSDIGITDTGTIKISGNTVLGAADTLTLWFDGTNWVEIAQANN